MSEPMTPDSPVIDDLDVDAALSELGMDLADLDRELALAESAGTGLPGGIWDPTPGFEERINERVAQRIRDREAMWVLADLAGLGWLTLKAVTDNEITGTGSRGNDRELGGK